MNFKDAIKLLNKDNTLKFKCRGGYLTIIERYVFIVFVTGDKRMIMSVEDALSNDYVETKVDYNEYVVYKRNKREKNE